MNNQGRHDRAVAGPATPFQCNTPLFEKPLEYIVRISFSKPLEPGFAGPSRWVGRREIRLRQRGARPRAIIARCRISKCPLLLTGSIVRVSRDQLEKLNNCRSVEPECRESAITGAGTAANSSTSERSNTITLAFGV
jgi:hypothetical protein